MIRMIKETLYQEEKFATEDLIPLKDTSLSLRLHKKQLILRDGFILVILESCYPLDVLRSLIERKISLRYLRVSTLFLIRLKISLLKVHTLPRFSFMETLYKIT
jgi:hypothetical protein